MRLLKALWDFKGMLIDVYKDWKRALWKNINTDDLETQNKNLLKALRLAGNNDPIIKGWQVYRDIEDNIKNMSVVLPLINDLHSDALRDRHWAMLAKTCGVDGINPSDPKFTMDDMMKLKLHEHVDDVARSSRPHRRRRRSRRSSATSRRRGPRSRSSTCRTRTPRCSSSS
jgi:dynein heavy chain